MLMLTISPKQVSLTEKKVGGLDKYGNTFAYLKCNGSSICRFSLPENTRGGKHPSLLLDIVVLTLAQTLFFGNYIQKAFLDAPLNSYQNRTGDCSRDNVLEISGWGRSHLGMNI